ncbi:MAG: class I SAM-dependent methyltransferase [Hydrococcus sp. Prado102]|jgi:SAM-dependent methyltransferase|nr:class I SAM-dependent methyltransferase [Hydrococcus sp. Prado102]
MTVLPEHICSVCGSPHLEPFFTMSDVPIFCNVLHSEQQEARDCPKGDIVLAFCPSCGFISNVAFDPDKLHYSQDYENSLHYSPRFREYIDALAKQLIERYDLYGKNIIEIGCGKGDFLVSLCELGNNKGVGFDPSYIPRAEHRHLGERVKFIQDFYSEDYRDYQADLICCRHTLEHVANPADLLIPLRKAIGDRLNTVVFFEVPNAIDTFHRLAIWDILYEHCTYFVPSSLKQVFSDCGFKITNLTEAFAGQFLCLEALPVTEKVILGDRILLEESLLGATKERQLLQVGATTQSTVLETSTLVTSKVNYQDWTDSATYLLDQSEVNNAEEVELLHRDIEDFTNNFQTKIATWEQKLAQIAQTKQRAVVWGAGAKGVTFLNLLKVRGAIEYIVDMNFRKHWKYVAGTGQQIVPPEFLQAYRPDVVIVMNPIYEEEIRQLVAELGLTCEIFAV